MPRQLMIIYAVSDPFLLPNLALIECAGPGLTAENETAQNNHNEGEKDFFHLVSLPFLRILTVKT
jgi:hypothetical protein